MDFKKYQIPVLDKTGFGRYITKTMHLLENSTKEKPGKIKIAFTGQSITDPNNTWPADLAEWLREKYPFAEITCKNFAIGGFSTQYLHKRMPNDIASFYPDLIICYDKGDHYLYDRMIGWICENTASEIMIQTEHYTNHDKDDGNWSDTMSYRHLPEIAEKYGAQLCDIRTPWKNYIRDNGLDADILLSDGAHLNDGGQKFMLELMKQFFVYREEYAQEAKEYLDSRYFEIKPGDWQGNKLTLPFFGNRVEITGGVKRKISVRINGKKPSEIKEAYIRTAENTSISTRMGIITYKKPPTEQTFTITVRSFKDEKNFVYSAEGSKTGYEGVSDEQGRLDGNYLYLTDESFTFHPGVDPPCPGEQFTFDSVLNGTDYYIGGDNLLISGIPSGEYLLELETEPGDEIPDIKFIKVYNPVK
jgi:hypothetical protein